MSTCLYHGCQQPGDQLDQGQGFRFCDKHKIVAEAILAGKEAPRKETFTWKCHHPRPQWNQYRRNTGAIVHINCRACANGKALTKKNPTRYTDWEHEANQAYTRLKEKNTWEKYSTK